MIPRTGAARPASATLAVLLSLFTVVMAGAGCGAPSARHRFVSTAMGCEVSITIDDSDGARAREAARAAQEELERIDFVLSDWKRTSELAALHGSNALRFPASDTMRDALGRALAIAAATEGRFDPTVGSMVALWREARSTGTMPADDALDAARQRAGYGKVRIEDGCVVRKRDDLRLDFGGIGKGYGAIAALRVLESRGCPRALVAVAGDIAAGEAPRGEAGWRIEIASESADVPDETLYLVSSAASTSGGSMQWFESGGVRYAHIVDIRTGLGATDPAQVTVVGPLDPAVDALGTALTVASDDEAARVLAAFPGFRARIERHGHARWIP